MDSMTQIATATLFMASLGVLLAGMLAYANRRLYVWEDPRIGEVEGLLPNANCGACGSPGCHPFAEQLVAGEVEPSRCTVNSSDMNQAIADFLGVDLGTTEKRVARLACAGGSHVSYVRANYSGLKSCNAAALVAGGGKGCTWACLGLGDCGVACDFDAISFNRFSLPVVDNELCTACGDCVDVCPKDLFSLQPIGRQLWVACNNRDDMDESESHCEVACTACARCVSDSPEGLIAIRDNLAVIDYEKNQLASRVAIERCPTGAIVWFDDRKGALRGVEAKRISRREPAPRMEPLPRA